MKPLVLLKRASGASRIEAVRRMHQQKNKHRNSLSAPIFFLLMVRRRRGSSASMCECPFCVSRAQLDHCNEFLVVRLGMTLPSPVAIFVRLQGNKIMIMFDDKQCYYGFSAATSYVSRWRNKTGVRHESESTDRWVVRLDSKSVVSLEDALSDAQIDVSPHKLDVANRLKPSVCSVCEVPCKTRARLARAPGPIDPPCKRRKPVATETAEWTPYDVMTRMSRTPPPVLLGVHKGSIDALRMCSFRHSDGHTVRVELPLTCLIFQAEYRSYVKEDIRKLRAT